MKTPIAINIGLNTTHGTRLDVHTATFQASRLGQIIASRVTDSPAGSEQTLALSILASGTRETFDAALYFIAQSLSQDCISCYDGAEGKLIGPNAEAWRAFEPAYFVNPVSGLTLADEWSDAAGAAGLAVDETPVDNTEWLATVERIKKALSDVLEVNKWKRGSAKARAAEYALTIGAEAVLGKPSPWLTICRVSGRSILD